MHSLKNYIKYYLLPENSSILLSLVCLFFGVFSIFVSVTLFILAVPITGNINAVSYEMVVLFIGLWAPALIGLANYFKK